VGWHQAMGVQVSRFGDGDVNRTKIEWTDYTWNPITGCKGGCHYCYARKIYQRFNRSFEPQFHIERLTEPIKLKKASKIFTCSVSDFFADWNEPIWKLLVQEVMHTCPQHTFQILTKKHLNIYELGKNVWVGVSITSRLVAQEKIDFLVGRSDAKVKFVSFEPLQDKIHCDLGGINWIIIGAQTNPYRPPKKEWVEHLIEQAREYNIPIFLKDNLHWPERIQEYPDGHTSARGEVQ